MKHLESATEQLGKFESELKNFNKWMTTADKELQVVVKDLDTLKSVVDKHKVIFFNNLKEC